MTIGGNYGAIGNQTLQPGASLSMGGDLTLNVGTEAAPVSPAA